MTVAVLTAACAAAVFAVALAVTWDMDVRRRKCDRRRELQDLRWQQRLDEQRYRRGLRELR